MILRSEILQHVLDATLLMHEGKLIAGLSAVGGRIVEGGIHFDQGIAPIEHFAFADGRGVSLGRLDDRLGRQIDRQGGRAYELVDNVAVIPIEGTLVHKGGYVGMSSGRTSYQGLQTQVVRAAKDDAVKGVVFEVDSYGGEAAGAFETADVIAKLSEAKPTIAILTDFAFSAGYLMASAARQIVMPALGGAGSIGALRLHADVSKKLEKDGITVTVMAAGKRKTDGSSFSPLPDEVKTRMLSRLEEGRQIFAGAVGRYRGNRFPMAAAMATEAGDYSGAEAVKIGMADAVGAPKDAFEAFLTAVNRKKG